MTDVLESLMTSLRRFEKLTKAWTFLLGAYVGLYFIAVYQRNYLLIVHAAFWICFSFAFIRNNVRVLIQEHRRRRVLEAYHPDRETDRRLWS